jgi:HD-GYP domain-containing protein (c-di-GMP phosphodiesterase class II)
MVVDEIFAQNECKPLPLGVKGPGSRRRKLRTFANGGGYPRGLEGHELSLSGRIVAVADCYDALISERPYRAGMPMDRVLQILQEGTGKQFDPDVMRAFLRVIGRKQGSEPSEVVPTPVYVGLKIRG